ncbi:MAG: CBS domain-containing protein [Deltaproteobacteria bacterium]|nr:CBS domain-containing protein [Deltaproteobacteria bacterium]
MYIARHMTTSPVTVTPDTLLPEVREIMNSRKFRHLPVVDERKRLIGMITDRDLRSAYPSSLLPEDKRQVILDNVAKTQVRSIMAQKLISLSPLATLDDALYFLSREKVGLLPVVDEEQHILGVFSVQDLMKAYKKLYGIGERGSALIAVEDDGLPKPLTRIVRALEEKEIRFSRLTRVHGEQGEKNIIYLRVHTFNLNGVHKALKEIGMAIIVPDLHDMLGKSRS